MHLIFLLLLLFAPGCKRGSLITHFQGNAHTHPYHIQVGHPLSPKAKEDITLLLQECFEEIDTRYNHWNPHSELSQINQLELEETFSLSSSLLSLIEDAKQLTTLTEGHFDPTLGSLIAVWKSSLTQKTLPAHTDHIPSGWHLFPIQNGIIQRLSPDACLDLDGLLKGLTIDLILLKLSKKGYENIYVEWGGDMAACGTHPSGRAWHVYLPEFGLIPLNGALATSGIQAQCSEINGRLYSHIVVPESRQALPQMHTVTVFAPTCQFADALATALMTFPSTIAAKQFLDKHADSLEKCTIWMRDGEGNTQKWN